MSRHRASQPWENTAPVVIVRRGPAGSIRRARARGAKRKAKAAEREAAARVALADKLAAREREIRALAAEQAAERREDLFREAKDVMTKRKASGKGHWLF